MPAKTESKTWHVWASVGTGTGRSETEESTIEGTRADAERELWRLLDLLDVDTAIIEDGEEE